VEELPVKQKKLKVRERHFTYYYIRCNGMTAIHRRGSGDIWQGLWEPLLIENGTLKMEDFAARSNNVQCSMFNGQRSMVNGQWSMVNGQWSMVNGQWSMVNGQWSMFNGQWSMFNGQCLKQGYRHVLTHQVLLADFYLIETDSRPDLPPDFIWIAEADLDSYALPRLVERLLECLRK
jgi:A/G-specific adenine glycosylase